MQSLIVFANDFKEDLWFAWRQDQMNGEDCPIFCFQEDENCPPPTKVAENFLEFIQEVALGKRMQELDLRKTHFDSVGSEIPPTEHDDQEFEEYVPPKAFKPSPGSSFF